MSEGGALRQLLAEFTVEVDKAGNLEKGQQKVDTVAASMVALQRAMDDLNSKKLSELFGSFGAAQGDAARPFGPFKGPGDVATPIKGPSQFQQLIEGAKGLGRTIGGFLTNSLHEAEHAVHGLHLGFHEFLNFVPGPLRHLAHTLLGPLGVAGAAAFAAYELSHMTLEAAESAKTLDASARKLGISSHEYQVLGELAQEAGSDVSSMGVAVRTLSAAVVTPSKETAEAFARIGIRAEELKGMSPEEVFYKVGGAIGELSDAQVKQEVTAKLMGRGGQDLIPIFEGGTEAVKEHRKEIEELGVAYDDDFIAKSKELVKQVEDMDLVWTRLRNQGLSLLLPALTELFRTIGHLIMHVQKFTAQLHAPRIALVALAAVIPSLAPFTPLLAGFALMAGRAAVRFALMIAPLLVLEDLIGFFRGDDSEIGAIMQALFGKETAEGVQKQAEELVQVLKDVWYWLTGAGMGDTAKTLYRDLSDFVSFIANDFLRLLGIKAQFETGGSGTKLLDTGRVLYGAATGDVGNALQAGADLFNNRKGLEGDSGLYGPPTIPLGPGQYGPPQVAPQANVTVGDTVVNVNGVNPNNAAAVAGAVKTELGRNRDAIISPYIPALGT